MTITHCAKCGTPFKPIPHRTYVRISIYFNDKLLTESSPFCANCFLRFALSDVEAGVIPNSKSTDVIQALGRLRGISLED